MNDPASPSAAFSRRGSAGDTRLFRDAFGNFATGVAVATCAPPGEPPKGLTVNSLASVSLEPPLALFCVETKAVCLKYFLQAGHFALNILPEGADDLSNRFAYAHDLSDADAYETWSGGAPILPQALAVADCRLSDAHGGGDHVILVGRVLETALREGRPLLYFRGGYDRLAD